MLLAIDTSHGTSVAVVDRDAGVLSVRSSGDTIRHAEVVGALIRSALTDSGVEVRQLSGVATGMGPGPFTGLRVGIAAAKGFAIGAGTRLVPVVSHDAIAFARYASGASGALSIVTDARRRELYVSRYSGVDEAGLPVRIGAPAITTEAALGAETGDVVLGVAVDAGALGMLAETMWAAGRPFPAEEALYLRSPDAVPGRGKRVTG